MYVAYVALVAITNLVIGFMLATILGDPREILARCSTDRNRGRDTEADNGALVQAAVNSHADSAAASAREDQDDPVAKADNSRGAQHFDGTWTEITSAVADRAESFETSLSSLAMKIDASNGVIAGEEGAAVKQLAVDETTKWLAAAEQVMESLSKNSNLLNQSAIPLT